MGGASSGNIDFPKTKYNPSRNQIVQNLDLGFSISYLQTQSYSESKYSKIYDRLEGQKNSMAPK